MEEKFMKLAREKYIRNKEENNLVERDRRYDEVDICRSFARYSKNYGEAALERLFKEITEEVQHEAKD